MDKFIILFETLLQSEHKEVVDVFKIKKTAKTLEGVKKKALIGILEKPYKRMFMKSTIHVPSVNLSSKARKNQKIQRLELERVKTQALDYARRIR